MGRGRHSQDKDVNWNPRTEKGAQDSFLPPSPPPPPVAAALQPQRHGQMSSRGRVGEDEGAGEGVRGGSQAMAGGVERRPRETGVPLHTRALEALQTLHPSALCGSAPLPHS